MNPGKKLTSTGRHLIDAENPESLVVASGHELSPGRRVRDVGDGRRVIDVNVQRPSQVTHVESVHVVVLKCR